MCGISETSSYSLLFTRLYIYIHIFKSVFKIILLLKKCTDKIVGRKWENAMTIDKYSWSYRRNARSSDVFTIQHLIYQLVKTVSYGGKRFIFDRITKK